MSLTNRSPITWDSRRGVFRGLPNSRLPIFRRGAFDAAVFGSAGAGVLALVYLAFSAIAH